MSVWDGKPRRWKYGELRSTVIMTKTFGLYRASEIDEFHAKLRAHYESVEEKLEAVRGVLHDEATWFAENKIKRDWLEEIREILEVEAEP